MTVDLNNADRALLEKALKKLGYDVTRTETSFTFKKGQITGSYNGKALSITAPDKKTKVDTDEIKREYSRQVILKIAERKRKEGWEMTQENGEYVLRREASSGQLKHKENYGGY